MSVSNISAERLATLTGGGILAAAANMNIMATGGYFTSHAALVASLTLGVFAGARVIGAGASGKIAMVIITALVAGEGYNFAATSERVVVERENSAAPLKDLAIKHQAAISRLHSVETSEVTSARLDLAKQAQTKATKEYTTELRTGGRCARICNGLKADAAKADTEVSAAADEAQKLHIAAVEAAKKDVEANPLPASSTPLADRLGWPAWVLDLVMAGLLSVGANGLAGTLIAYGAHSTCKPSLQVAAPVSDNAQTDFDPNYADNVIRFYRPDQGGNGGSGSGHNPKPRPNGPTGLSKDQALSDILKRLADGETIPSQDSLASDWGRSKQTVSDWMKDWRRIGVIPAPVRVGKFKMTVAG